MLVKIFTIKFDALTGVFDDSEVHRFIQDKEVLQVRDHLLIRNEIPYLVLVIKYYPFRKEAQPGGHPPSEEKSARHRESWKTVLGDADLPLFNLLRDWRSERCKKDGAPPYLIFTNAQLAAIVKAKPQSLSDLGRLDGIGKGKTDRYGADVLAITVKKEEDNG